MGLTWSSRRARPSSIRSERAARFEVTYAELQIEGPQEIRTPLCKTFLRIALAIALLLTPALAAAAGRDRHKSDVEDVKEDIDNAKKGLDSAGKLKKADKNDVKKAGKDRANEEAGDRPILPES